MTPSIQFSGSFFPALPNSNLFFFFSFPFGRTSIDDVLSLYKRITGEELDMVNVPEEEE